MANAHIPKHGFSSPGCVSRNLRKHSFNRGELFHYVAKWLNVCKYAGLTTFMCFSTLCLVAQQPLPDGWWQQSSAENILAKAKSITHDLNSFHGKKTGLLTDRQASIEIFQRLLPDSTIETKQVFRTGGAMMIEYKLRNGRYILTRDRSRNHLAKLEYDDNQKENSLASTPGHHYDYKMLQPEIVGDNDCLVVARVATPDFLTMLKAAYYPGFTNHGSPDDPVKYIRSTVNSYIRKTDGVIIGKVKKNNTGEVLEDLLYDVVRVGDSIPDSEFDLPKASLETTATNIVQFSRDISKAKHSSSNPWKRPVLVGIMATSLSLLAFLLYKFQRRKADDR